MIHKLEIDSVVLEFGEKRVLSDIYISSETGKITGLLGRNGSGKSCLMKIITGNLKPNSQSFRIDGYPIYKLNERYDNIAYLPQTHYVPLNLTLKRVFKDYKISFDELVNSFPAFDLKYSSSLKSLSTGERRIIEIYLVIKMNRHFSLLDEPFSFLSPLQVDFFKEIIKQESTRKGFIITDHMYRHVVDLSDKIYLLREGATHRISELSDLERLGYSR